MAFHVSCPITCRKVCFCALGFPGRLRSEKGVKDFLQEVARVEQFLNDPWLIKGRENATIQVKVPKVIVAPAPLAQVPATPEVGCAAGEGVAASDASEKVKRAALQKQAAAASSVAEDYARRFESGDKMGYVRHVAGEERGQSNSKAMCRLCFCGENDGSERIFFTGVLGVAPHAEYVRTGDPNKFMFCKRCDGAYHCYCQQPPHKNVGHGPYLCPKHTKCHSCGSSVPGNGLGTRWFLGYTCCDACGRLFVKGNYCPVCLKVYRDSESTPMVCCDICQRWVHCPCDGISDAKYLQFQVDGNLQYVCPTCRGECCQVRNLDEAVQELWKRRDEADKDLIANLRAVAGFPMQEEIFDISPFSDDEESGSLLLKNEHSSSLKFSVKGLGDNSPRKNKEHGKKSSNKKCGKKKRNETSFTHGTDDPQSFEEHMGGLFLGYRTGDVKKGKNSCPVNENLTGGNFSVGEAGVSKHKYVDEVTASHENKTLRTIKIRGNKPHDLTNEEDISNDSSVSKGAQGPKLVIHLGGRSRNTTTSPPRSDTSIVRKGQDLTPPNGHYNDDPLKVSFVEGKEGHLIDAKKDNTEFSEFTDGYESVSLKDKHSAFGKRGTEDIESSRSGSDILISGRNTYSSRKYAEDGPTISGDLNDDSIIPSVPQASLRDHKPYLKFKIPNNSKHGNQTPVKEEITYTRGQRSKRRRPALEEGDASQWQEDNTMKEFTDANWVLQKLGKDAAGKRVEIHQSSTNSWHRGTVTEVYEGTSTVSIDLDNGKTKKFELGKQGIRFVSQKQRR
ncbi:hypothetical protein F511_21432 [Dorcoceras hygrometricum]|uniref:PHD-type domain-containing protein n=1 Tax=Dorcoceras hygrometricum TaxID=472368 RepID=A0A2Z7C857_9LAMI|nr:hypothetical protein F511_21432 [Dorcoceras hygrometricum]